MVGKRCNARILEILSGAVIHALAPTHQLTAQTGSERLLSLKSAPVAKALLPLRVLLQPPQLLRFPVLTVVGGRTSVLLKKGSENHGKAEARNVSDIMLRTVVVINEHSNDHGLSRSMNAALRRGCDSRHRDNKGRATYGLTWRERDRETERGRGRERESKRETPAKRQPRIDWQGRKRTEDTSTLSACNQGGDQPN